MSTQLKKILEKAQCHRGKLGVTSIYCLSIHLLLFVQMVVLSFSRPPRRTEIDQVVSPVPQINYSEGSLLPKYRGNYLSHAVVSNYQVPLNGTLCHFLHPHRPLPSKEGGGWAGQKEVDFLATIPAAGRLSSYKHFSLCPPCSISLRYYSPY